LQLFKLTLVFLIVLANNPNIYLIIWAALGRAVSLYFGYFRWQYIWSRNKVRYDLMQKIDQRSDLAAKLLMLCEISTAAEPRKARLRALLRRYFPLLQQVNFYQNEGVFDEAILKHFRVTIATDLGHIFSHDTKLVWAAERE
jgi:hypothetical protein